MQRNANMLKILKKCVFADFIGFFAKIQSPVCHPNELLSFGEILQYTMYQVFTKFQMGIKKNSVSENRSSLKRTKSDIVIPLHRGKIAL